MDDLLKVFLLAIIAFFLFVLSDTVLAWNKFVSPIESAGYFIMIPYYLGQLTLFIQSLNTQKTSD